MKLRPFHPLSQGLLLTLMFNEGGGSIVYDATGNQNHGIGTNIAWGRDGLDLPGSNEHIVIPNLIRSTDNWTLFTSFTQLVRNPDTQSTDTVLVSMQKGTGTGRSWLFIDDCGTLTYTIRSYIDGVAHAANTAINTGVAYTVGLTHDNSSFNFYLNGADDGNFNATPDAADGDLILFDTSTAIGNGCFAGTVRVFHLYNRPLSAQEMMWLDYDSFMMFDADIVIAPFHTYVGIDELGRLVDITGGVSNTESQAYLDVSISLPISIAVDITDIETYPAEDLSIAASIIITNFDGEPINETDLSVSIASAVSNSDIWTYLEYDLLISPTIVIIITDLLAGIEDTIALMSLDVVEAGSPSYFDDGFIQIDCNINIADAESVPSVIISEYRLIGRTKNYYIISS